jgi:hypothetical protein
MTYPAFDTSHIAGGLNARGGPITCDVCGCRLQRSADGEELFFHFAPVNGRDARGCLVACAEAPHNALGRPLVAA